MSPRLKQILLMQWEYLIARENGSRDYSPLQHHRARWLAMYGGSPLDHLFEPGILFPLYPRAIKTMSGGHPPSTSRAHLLRGRGAIHQGASP